MSEARAAILKRIREQLGRPADLGSTALEQSYKSIPRNYRQAGERSPRASTELLLERLVDYDAEAVQIDETNIATTVAAILQCHNESVLLVPPDLPASWLPSNIEILRDQENPGIALPQSTLTRVQAVFTPCAGAIAETGTILLEHGPQQGRRTLTLLPDHHICILRPSQIVETVSEGLDLLAAAKTKAVTTISGPSATADIEMTRIRGVHGPRRLTILIVSP